MNKTYLIIGHTKGIGAQVAAQLHELGHNIIGFGRTSSNAAYMEYTVDVTTGELPTLDTPLDGIVYCAGSINLRPFKALKQTDFLTDYTINVLGAVRVLQQYHPLLLKAPNPSVVLFSTVAVQMGMPYHASIAAAKGAVEGLVRSLAAEWVTKIRVNCIAPSLTDTPLAAALLNTEAKRTAAAERHPQKTIGESAGIAAMACMLLSDATKFMTGQVIKMDGGISSVKL